MTYRARCAGHKRRTPRRPLPVPYVETLDVDPVGVAFMGGTVHGFTVANPQKAFVDIIPSGPATVTIQAQGKA